MSTPQRKPVPPRFGDFMLEVRRCQRCRAQLAPTETSTCDQCKRADENRVYVSNNTQRPWHIKARSGPGFDGVSSATVLTACETPLIVSSLNPGWPREVTGLKELARQYPDALVCRQCSDRAPLS